MSECIRKFGPDRRKVWSCIQRSIRIPSPKCGIGMRFYREPHTHAERHLIPETSAHMSGFGRLSADSVFNLQIGLNFTVKCDVPDNRPDCIGRWFRPCLNAYVSLVRIVNNSGIACLSDMSSFTNPKRSLDFIVEVRRRNGIF